MDKIKKYFLAGICVVGILFSMTGCGGEDYALSEIAPETVTEGSSENGRAEDTQKEGSTPAKEDGMIAENSLTDSRNDSLLHTRDFEEIKAYLSNYSNELKELEKTASFIILHAVYHSGREYWDAFLESVDKGEPAEVVMVQFTVEGDAILYYLQYNGTDFYVVEDYSRDAFSSEPGYLEKTYPYLSVLEGMDEYGDRWQDIVLTDRENLTMELLEQYWDDELMQEEIDVFWIGTLSMGNEEPEITESEVAE